ncbi:acyltransferase family protein [Edaphobacter aggregans]|uniref:acyltransferase family protein n=1 Tax=Edaphobacter aggregans TaxID=570835 RepID=UPI000558470C|nr:acyltransferase [Edaphobacter aggregans]
MTNRMTQHGADRLIQRHMPELDVLRGCAILAVLLYHGLYWSIDSSPNRVFNVLVKATVGGWLGVNLFFVLSGFLITGILIDTKGRPDYYRRFYLRRVLRILPAYVAMLVVLLLVRWLTLKSALLCLLFLANYEGLYRYFHLGTYGPFWSLSVEEQFYLIWPAIVARVSVRGLAFLSLALCLVEPLLRLLSASSLLPLGNVHTATYLIADNLAIGALAAIFARSRYGTLSNGIKAGLGLCLAGAMIFAVGYPFGITHRTNLVGDSLQTVPWNIIFTGVLLLLLGLRSPFFSGRLAAPLRFFGDISYGLYLIHVMIFVRYDDMVRLLPAASWKHALRQPLTRLFLCAGLSVLLAWLSRRFYEERFLRMGRAPVEPKVLEEAVK